jgi:Ca-activated chloride channel family protein
MRALPAALLLATLGAGASSQQPPPTPKPFSFSVDVEVVSLTAVVHDKAGRFIPGLKAADVEVFEDGVKQELIYLVEAKGGEEKIPLSVVLVLDASGSMKRNLGFLQSAASHFVDKLEDVDQALVVQFNETIKGSAEFTDDPDRLVSFIDALQAWGGTSLYDAIHYALGRIKDQPGRKAIVVFSDGDDTTSSIEEREVVDYARAVEATVYSVGIQGMGPGGMPRGFLKKIAAESGGEAFFPDKVGDLLKVFATISEELHTHYVLAYTPKRDPDNRFRTLSLKLVSRTDAEVRMRKGYFATKRKRR